MVDQYTAAWSLLPGSVGTITQDGIYTAPATTGSAAIEYTSGTVTGSASVRINDLPRIMVQAAVAPSPIAGTSANLTVLGTDAGGGADLTNTWTVVPGESTPAPVTFLANGTNAAQNTTATFTSAGNYILLATAADPGGLSATSMTRGVIRWYVYDGPGSVVAELDDNW